jgi:hypothetical protein
MDEDQLVEFLTQNLKVELKEKFDCDTPTVHVVLTLKGKELSSDYFVNTPHRWP